MTRYKLHAYVCGTACTKSSPFEGWATFDQIFNHRPNDCRYGVAQTTAGDVLVWDFYCDALLEHNSLVLRAPPPVRMGFDLDAMTMATMMTYGDEA